MRITHFAKNPFLVILMVSSPILAQSIHEIIPAYGPEIKSEIKQEEGIPAPAQGAARELADGEAPEVYTVESGDTLYDICDQLLSDGNYWPKLWSLNPFIKNPNILWPGMRLNFYPGDEDNPPFMEVAQEDEVLPVDKEKLSMDALLEQDMLLDKMVYHVDPTEIIGMDDLPARDENFQTVGHIYHSDGAPLTIPGFLFPEKQKPLCEVISGSAGESLLMESEEFLCTPEQENLELNKTYTIIRLADSSDSFGQYDFSGIRYQFVAQVRLKQFFEKDNIYSGEITKSRLGVEKNDIIVPFLGVRRVTSFYKDQGKPAATQGNIISFDQEGLEFGGEGNVIFINKGIPGGFLKGQTYRIHQKMQAIDTSILSSTIPSELIPVGKVRIIDSNDTGSIGYISENILEISIGDVVGL